MSSKPLFPKSRPARQSDVAARAGVSTATVSRVLNGSSLVREDARARVRAAIDALGYVPNMGARSLATRRSLTLGAIVPTLENAIFAAGLNAFEAEARRRGYGLVISVSNYAPAQEVALIRQMIERKVDGLLLVGNDRDPAAEALLQTAGLRHLGAWTHDPAHRTVNVGFDNFAAMAPVIDHLVALGRRRIAILGGIGAGNDRARARRAGAEAALDAHGLAPHAADECTYSLSEARDAARRLLDARPDALVCGNDVIAAGALWAARENGLHVPADLAVTGFDDLPLAAALAPALTTIHVPARRMGRAAAAALVEAAETGAHPTPSLIGTALVVRDSTRGAA